MDNKTDKLALVLMWLALILIIIRESPQGGFASRVGKPIAAQPEAPAPAKQSVRTEYEDGKCPFCTFVSIAEGEANKRRSLSAHLRQMHPKEWKIILGYQITN